MATSATPSGGESNLRGQLTAWADTPWFWMAAFAYAGLVWLVAMGPKYAGRQERDDRRFEARQAIALKRATGLLPANPQDDGQQAADDRAVAEGVAPSPHKPFIPLDPLVFMLAFVLEGAVAKLLWPNLMTLSVKQERK
jgi:hypothetical protein